MSDEKPDIDETRRVSSDYVQRAAERLGVPVGNNLFIRPVIEFVHQNYNVLEVVAEAISAKEPQVIANQADALQMKIGALGLPVVDGKAREANNPAWLEKTETGDWRLAIDQSATGGKNSVFLKELVHEWGAWFLIKYLRFEDKSQLIQIKAASENKMIPQTHMVDAVLLLMVKDRETTA